MKKLKLNDLTNKDDDNTNIILNTDSHDTYNDLIALKAVDELLNLSKLKTITRINPDQVDIISKLYLFSTVFKVPFTSQLADTILQLQISLHGLGRQELVQLVNQRSAVDVVSNTIKTSKDIFR